VRLSGVTCGTKVICCPGSGESPRWSEEKGLLRGERSRMRSAARPDLIRTLGWRGLPESRFRCDARCQVEAILALIRGLASYRKNTHDGFHAFLTVADLTRIRQVRPLPEPATVHRGPVESGPHPAMLYSYRPRTGSSSSRRLRRKSRRSIPSVVCPSTMSATILPTAGPSLKP